ncbi:class E sortase [Kitasatospora sp. MAP5-34]|uniref:class E sortase n=1 Tax=Kitasatospora sp. MAP5-34 TaxID=3035102 RepID=UPI0024753E00|nr:class E sortase [Kitasatospora sp. MAP5-34]MDH6576413.1 sortase A [Kitasatospora sp. MAP5-34]
MTTLRPEGGRQAGPDPGDWGVYEPAPEYPWPAGEDLGEQTMQLRAIPGVGPPAGLPAGMPSGEPYGGQEDGQDGSRAGRRQVAQGRVAQGRVALSAGNGRRRASGRSAGPRPRPKEAGQVVAARLVGELFITLGMLMLLFVAYQLWWTNVQADASAAGTRSRLEQQWNQAPPAPSGGTAKPAGAFEPGQGFAVLYIPKLGLKYPIAEGTGKQQVLDKGLVGHYTGTAMPADQAGNFAIAAHRTTHGQPFRKIGQLVPGDKIVVETATSFYTYQVAGGIPETPPSNVTVIQPVPKGSPFTQPGRYITLTTCTPEFSARGRLIVFGRLLDERPRSQGEPPALTGD